MHNPWSEMPKEEPFVLQMDIPAITIHNRKWRGTNFEIMPNVLPVPFVGDMFTSEIVILMLNPKYVEDVVEKEDKTYFTEKLYHVFNHSCEKFPFFCLDPKINSGKRYWESKLKELQFIYKGWENVSRMVSNIQFHAYNSKEFKFIDIPSQFYNAYLVEKAIERKAIIVMGRGKDQWLRLVPKLRDYNFLTLNSQRNPTLSKKNCPTLFEQLLNKENSDLPYYVAR
jgi:hypothetical protein